MMNSIKVIHVITTLESGGAEKQLLILAREQAKQGHNVSVVYLKGAGELRESFQSDGVRVIDSLANRNPLLQVILLRRFLHSIHNSLIIHAHLPRAEVVSSLTQKRFRLIITRHNAEPFAVFLPTRISSYLSRLVIKRSTCVIAISKAVKDFLFAKSEITKNSQIFLIHYSYDPNIVSKSVKPLPRHPNPFKIVTLARLSPQKDLATLIEAAKLMKDAGLKFELDIYGEGPLFESLNMRIFHNGLEGIVNLRGRTLRPEILLPNYDLFVLPSIYEGFGLSVLEALQAGLRLILSDLSVFREIMGETFDGFFMPANPNGLFLLVKKTCFEGRPDWSNADRDSILAKFDVKRLSYDTSVVYLHALGKDGL